MESPCKGMTIPLTIESGIINSIWSIGGITPSPYVYKLAAYEDIDFFIN